MIRRVWLWASAVLLLAAYARAAETPAGSFLRLGAGARAAGLGNAYTGLSTDGTAIYWNPAALTRLKTKSLVLMRSSLFDSEYTYDFVGWGGVNRKGWGTGLALQHVSAGSIPQTDINGNAAGSFTPRDLAFSAGVAKNLRGHSLGLVGKYVTSKISRTASTFTGGIGYLSPPLAERRLRLGVVADNLFGGLRFDQQESPLPRVLRAGFAAKIADNWLAVGDLERLRGGDTTFGTGAEYRRAFGADAWEGALRFGYTSRAGARSGVVGPTFGLGALWRRLSVDYAFVPEGDLGYSHLISLGFWFPPPVEAAPSRRRHYILK